MRPLYFFSVDTERNIIRVLMSGTFGPKDLAGFQQARLAAHEQLTCAAHQHVTCVNALDMENQSPATAEAFRKLLADPQLIGKAIAIVIGRPSLQTQAEVAARGRGARFFTNAAEADEWIVRQTGQS